MLVFCYEFEALYAAASDPLIWQQHPDPLRYQRDVFQRYFDSGIASKGCLVIEDIKTGEVIGSSRFYDFSENNSVVAFLDKVKKQIRREKRSSQ